MSRTLILALSGLVGSGGVLLIIRGLIPYSVPFASAYERFHKPPDRARVIESASDGGFFGDLGALTGPKSYALLNRWGYDFTSRSTDLRVLRLSESQFAFRKLAFMLGGAILPMLGSVFVAGLGLQLPVFVPLLFVIAGAALGFFLPDLDLKQRATQAREDHVAALAAWLELSRALIASHMSPVAALTTAANQGTGPAFGEFKAACGAIVNKDPIHKILDDLGADMAISELRDLAGSIALAADKGVSIQDALAAKSLMLSNAQMLKERSDANSATSRMSGPLAFLGLTFTIFLGLPAIAALIEATTSGL